MKHVLKQPFVGAISGVMVNQVPVFDMAARVRVFYGYRRTFDFSLTR